jgi:hypothetical protein
MVGLFSFIGGVDMSLYPTTWPCDFFPVLRTILAEKTSWKGNNFDIVYMYVRYHIYFEVKEAIKHAIKK